MRKQRVTNPPLVFFGNPPLQGKKMSPWGRGREGSGFRIMGTLSEDVHKILYTHTDDGEDYQHDFEAGVEMHAVIRAGRREILLTHFSGKPLWQDFK